MSTSVKLSPEITAYSFNAADKATEYLLEGMQLLKDFEKNNYTWSSKDDSDRCRWIMIALMNKPQDKLFQEIMTGIMSNMKKAQSK